MANEIILYNLAPGVTDEQFKEYVDTEKGPYIDSLNKLKDAWGHEFKYLGNEDAKANADRYDIWSVGKDGEDGSDDDIKNWADDNG